MPALKNKKPVHPPTYLLAALALALGLHFVFPGPRLIPTPWNLVGLLPLAFGLVLNILADRQFKQAATTVKPFEASAALVTDGAFRISRNPMYLGFGLVLLGIAVLLGTLTPFGVAAIFVVFLDLKFIRPEERMLEETFDREFLAYCQKVRRWI